MAYSAELLITIKVICYNDVILTYDGMQSFPNAWSTNILIKVISNNLLSDFA